MRGPYVGTSVFGSLGLRAFSDMARHESASTVFVAFVLAPWERQFLAADLSPHLWHPTHLRQCTLVLLTLELIEVGCRRDEELPEGHVQSSFVPPIASR